MFQDSNVECVLDQLIEVCKNELYVEPPKSLDCFPSSYKKIVWPDEKPDECMFQYAAIIYHE